MFHVKQLEVKKMKWLNEEYEEYENNSYYSALCSNCQFIATFVGSVSKYYEYCPCCGEQVEKEEKEVENNVL